MDKRFTEEQYNLIDKKCEEKNVSTSQFCDYLAGFQGAMIEKAIASFINYCQADGWYDYGRK